MKDGALSQDAFLRRDRIAALRARMRAAGIDLLVCASNGLHQLDLPNPVAHLTDFRSIGESLALLHVGDGLRVIVAPAADAARLAARLCPGVAGTATDALAAAYREAIAATAPGRMAQIGLGALPCGLVEAMHQDRPVPPPFADFDVATGRKTAAEIAAARRATRIAEEAYDYLQAIARTGMRECDLAVAVKLFMKQRGANDSFLMLNAGRRLDAIMPSSERPLEAGDLILIELSPSVDGQFVQICRTSVLGPPSPDLVRQYGLLVRAMQAGIGAIRPGVPMSSVCAAIDAVLADAGYADYSRPPFIRRRGHGLGAGSIAPGDVAMDNPAVLEAGMMFIVHPNQMLPETGYMMCGEPVLVGAAGAEALTRRPPGLGVIDPRPGRAA